MHLVHKAIFLYFWATFDGQYGRHQASALTTERRTQYRCTYENHRWFAEQCKAVRDGGMYLAEQCTAFCDRRIVLAVHCTVICDLPSEYEKSVQRSATGGMFFAVQCTVLRDQRNVLRCTVYRDQRCTSQYMVGCRSLLYRLSQTFLLFTFQIYYIHIFISYII